MAELDTATTLSVPLHGFEPLSSEISLNRHADEEVAISKSTNEDQSIGLQKGLAILALCLCFTGSNIPTFFTGPGLTYIAPDVGNVDQASWIPNSASLAGTCVVLCIGYLQDIAGRRGSLAGGLVCMLVGSIVFATGHSFAQVVAGSTLMGIGSTIQELTAIAAIAELVPARRRGVYLAFPLIMTTLFAPAVLYANVLSEYATWRWLYYICLIWNGLTTILLGLTYFRMKIERHNQSTSFSTLKEVDFLGIFLLVTGLALLLVALQSGGETHSWSSAYVLVILLLGFFILAGFAFWETRAPGKPLVPVRIFQGQRVVALTFVVGLAAGSNYTTVLNLGPTIIKDVFNLSAVKTGLVALAPSLGLAVGAAIGNASLSFFQDWVREIVAGFSVIMTIFTAAQAVVTPSSYGPWIAMGTLSSLGIGASLIPLTTLVSLACPEDLIGTGVALTIAVRTLGGSIGYAIFHNIYTMEQRHNIMDGETYSQGSSNAAKIIYYATLAFGVLAVVSSVFLPNMKKFMTGKVLASS